MARYLRIYVLEWPERHLLQVYTLFLAIYKTSIVVGFGGYVLLILELFGIGLLLRPVLSPILSIQMLWYGLYFGVLGRDCAEVVSDTLVGFMPDFALPLM